MAAECSSDDAAHCLSTRVPQSLQRHQYLHFRLPDVTTFAMAMVTSYNLAALTDSGINAIRLLILPSCNSVNLVANSFNSPVSTLGLSFPFDISSMPSTISAVCPPKVCKKASRFTQHNKLLILSSGARRPTLIILPPRRTAQISTNP
jgi:hypothetical protein